VMFGCIAMFLLGTGMKLGVSRATFIFRSHQLSRPAKNRSLPCLAGTSFSRVPSVPSKVAMASLRALKPARRRSHKPLRCPTLADWSSTEICRNRLLSIKAGCPSS
jgi:hypothetical protein